MINDLANDHFWQVTLPKLKPRRPFAEAAFCRKLHGKLTFLKRFSHQNQFSCGRGRRSNSFRCLDTGPQSSADRTFLEFCLSVTRMSEIGLFSFWQQIVYFGELMPKELL